MHLALRASARRSLASLVIMRRRAKIKLCLEIYEPEGNDDASDDS